MPKKFKTGDLIVNKGQFYVIDSLEYKRYDLLGHNLVDGILAVKVDMATAAKTVGIRKFKPDDCMLATDYMRPMQRIMLKYSR